MNTERKSGMYIFRRRYRHWYPEEARRRFQSFQKLDEFTRWRWDYPFAEVIAERFDGYIAVESEIGKGSRFSIILPLNPKHTESD